MPGFTVRLLACEEFRLDDAREKRISVNGLMRILFLSYWFPYPADNGSKLRIYHLIEGLAQEHEVTLLSFDHQGIREVPDALSEICQEVYFLPGKIYSSKSLRAFLGLFQAKPRALVDTFEPQMFELIKGVTAQHSFDLVIASQWYMASYQEAFKAVPAIFEEVELGIFEDMRLKAPTLVRRLRQELTFHKLQYYYRNHLKKFAACTVASQEEQQLLHAVIPHYESVEVIPNGVELTDYQDIHTDTESGRLIYTGSFRYHPNYDAMCWFMETIFPLIQHRHPQSKVVITGDHAGHPLPNRAAVELTGYVDDVRPLIASANVSLAPIRAGGGTRLKILEAMALRTPVVSTSKGAEGLEVEHGEQLLIANTPDEFAEAVIALMEDKSLRDRLVANAYQLIARKYDWSVIMPHFIELAENVVANHRN
jgi:glycosyltransferase involved in cell wall biosynthesis